MSDHRGSAVLAPGDATRQLTGLERFILNAALRVQATQPAANRCCADRPAARNRLDDNRYARFLRADPCRSRPRHSSVSSPAATPSTAVRGARGTSAGLCHGARLYPQRRGPTRPNHAPGRERGCASFEYHHELRDHPCLRQARGVATLNGYFTGGSQLIAVVRLPLCAIYCPSGCAENDIDGCRNLRVDP
jgi:hypothetical protein